MNIAVFAGRVGQEAHLKRTKNGDAVANFPLAVDRFKKDDGPLWVSVSLWGKQAETLARHIKKDKLLTVSGQVDLRSFDFNGKERTELALRAQSITLQSEQNTHAEPGSSEGG